LYLFSLKKFQNPRNIAWFWSKDIYRYYDFILGIVFKKMYTDNEYVTLLNAMYTADFLRQTTTNTPPASIDLKFVIHVEE
jgi:hypothetical protein